MTKVKICGITSLDDARIAVDAGADMLGFNFYEKSPRYIGPSSAKAILEELPPQVISVGVFVNSSLAELERIYSDLSLDVIQLHGDESADFVSRLKAATGAKMIKVVRVSADFSASIALEYDVDHFMLDSDARAFGGSGATFDWDAAVKFSEFVPNFYLAGGLTPANVGEAIRKARPFAVDVCSGVELEKRIKDPLKVVAFVRNAKAAL
ncbi:MAG: phosphoribosylanthranilate isomerase [Acidobacteriota bacterium]